MSENKKTNKKNILANGLVSSKTKGKKIYLGTNLNSKLQFNELNHNNIKNIDVNKLENDEKPKINNLHESKDEMNNIINKDKVIHENNLKVIAGLEKQLYELEKEDILLNGDLKELDDEEKKIKEETEKLNKEINKYQEELENLKVINDEKNREYLHLNHLRLQQNISNSNTQSLVNSEQEPQNPLTHQNSRSLTNENVQQNEEPGHLTLGEVLNEILNLPRNDNDNDNFNINNQFESENESLEENLGPPLSFNQIENLPSSKYPRSDSNDKCVICGFDLCFNDVVTTLDKCQHTFHKECLGNFLLQKQSSKCPICKTSII